MMRLRIVAAALLLVAAMPATGSFARVQPLMVVCERQQALCPRPRLDFKPPPGWEESEEGGAQAGGQAYVPSGSTFADAKAVIYIRVLPAGEAMSLPTEIEENQQSWRQRVPDTIITKLAPLAAVEGVAFQLYRYFSPSRPGQSHEIIAFGEDRDPNKQRYFVMVVLSGSEKDVVDGLEGPLRQALAAP